MKLLFSTLLILFFTLIATADTTSVSRRLNFIEQDVKRIESNQINYRIEKDLLKETYSNNYEKINFFITFILGLVGILGYLGLKDINSIKKEYEEELIKLRAIQGQFDMKAKELDSDKKKFDEDLKSIISENEEQSRKIKFIELKDKVRTLLNDNSIASALEFANAALNIKFDDKDLLNQKGMILCRLNQMPEAVEAFKDALQKLPNDATTILNAAECFYFAREADAAKELVTQHKSVFDSKDNGKLLELFKIVELFFSENKEGLLEIARRQVNVDNLKIKVKYFVGWDLKEALHFIHYQTESELKNIVNNLLWFYDAQITGETLLVRLNINLPIDSNDILEDLKD